LPDPLSPALDDDMRADASPVAKALTQVAATSSRDTNINAKKFFLGMPTKARK